MNSNFLEKMMRGEDRDPPPKLAPDVEVVRLRDCLSALGERHEFAPGMIVRQKPQAAIYATLGDNDLAIVVEVLAEPIVGGLDKEGSPHFRERYDMLVGSIESGPAGDHDHFCVYHVDSRRFEPWRP